MRNPKAQLAMLAVCFALCTAAFRWASKPALPELAVPNGFGVNIHFRGEPRDLDLIAAGGFKVIRMDFSWSGVERKKGVYDFEKSGYDALTAGCLKRGIRILYILDYSNRLYESESSVRTDAGRRAFAAFAEAAAKRYRGKQILWEIWNEPNIKQFWKPEPNADDYCKLVEAAAPLVKKADPSGLVLAPATSTIPFPWLEDCFKRGLLRWVDAVSVHPYRPKPPETVIADYGRLRDLIKKYAPAGKEIPIVSGEWGYSHVNWDKSRLSDEQQAQYLAREFLVNLYQKIPVSIWYDWKNDGTDPNEREHNFGTMANDLQPTPTYDAAKTLARALDGYSVAERINTGSESDFVLRMKKGRRTALAAWTTSEKHDVTLKMKKGQGTLTDMLGGESALSWKADDLKLTLLQSPQYLLIK